MNARKEGEENSQKKRQNSDLQGQNLSKKLGYKGQQQQCQMQIERPTWLDYSSCIRIEICHTQADVMDNNKKEWDEDKGYKQCIISIVNY